MWLYLYKIDTKLKTTLSRFLSQFYKTSRIKSRYNLDKRTCTGLKLWKVINWNYRFKISKKFWLHFLCTGSALYCYSTFTEIVDFTERKQMSAVAAARFSAQWNYWSIIVRKIWEILEIDITAIYLSSCTACNHNCNLASNICPSVIAQKNFELACMHFLYQWETMTLKSRKIQVGFDSNSLTTPRFSLIQLPYSSY